MEMLMMMTYTAFCWAVFKIFKLPLNKWTVPTAILGGVVLIALVLMVMNYNHPYTTLVREYFVTTPIVPDVQGQVVEVPVEANRPLKEGDVLFRIDPAPYQYEVDRLEAALADATSGAAQLEERLRAAEAATAQARSNILTAESEYGRQAREALEQARAAIAQIQAQLELAREQYDRYQRLLSTDAVAQMDFDRAKRNFESAQAQLSQAQAAERQAAEKLESGGDRVQAAREQLGIAEAQQREARLAFEAESGGVNPKVRQITAELDRARWNLDQTTVRAPTDGFVTQLLLRPGMMAVSLPLRPAMTFIHTTAPNDRVLVGAFWQNSLQRLEPGDDVEVIYRAVPGRVFKGHVDRILPVLAQGQLQTSGTLETVESVPTPGRVPVVIKLEDDVSAYQLPAGVIGSAAIYTKHVHHVALIRKILLRMVSWQNYIFGELH
jgi:multidrug resistance efflux pump